MKSSEGAPSKSDPIWREFSVSKLALSEPASASPVSTLYPCGRMPRLLMSPHAAFRASLASAIVYSLLEGVHLVFGFDSFPFELKSAWSDPSPTHICRKWSFHWCAFRLQLQCYPSIHPYRRSGYPCAPCNPFKAALAQHYSTLSVF